MQSLSAQCEGSPVPLVLDSGLVVPPANLTDIPICVSFMPKDLQPHLRPRCIESAKQDTGPFLFTPLHFGGGSLDRKMKKAESKLGKVSVILNCCHYFYSTFYFRFFMGKKWSEWSTAKTN